MRSERASPVRTGRLETRRNAGLRGIRVGMLLLTAVAAGGCADRDLAERAAGEADPAADSMPAASAMPGEAGPRAATKLRTATKPFEFEAPADPQATAPACAFAGLDPAAPMKVFAAGAYAGRKLGFQIDRSGHEAGQIDVAVNHADVPVVLMLGAYDPVVWNIGWSQGTRIAAVLIGGYHRQVVTGLPRSVPVLVSTYDNKGPCGYFYVTAEKAGTLNPVARRAFGRPVDMVYPAAQGRVVVGNPLSSANGLITDAEAAGAASFRVADSLAGGEEGLAYAVSQGWLREARQADADAWLRELSRRPSADIPPIAGGRVAGQVHLHNAYVVLEAFELPPGLYGAHSASFFVPKGTPRPTGNPGHSTIYDFNTMACTGAMCRTD